MAVTDGDHLPPPKSPSGVPFLVISDVNTGRIIFDNARYAEEEYYNALPEIRKAVKGDILFTVTGSYGIVIPVDTERKFCFQRHIGLIKTLTSSPWISIALQSEYVLSYCDKVATGTAQKTVSLAHLRDLLIPIPPQREQERINEELLIWLDSANYISSNIKSLTNVIDRTKSKILDLAIHGKLVQQDPNDEPAIELLKRINPKFTPCDNAHYEKPYEIPKSWEWVKLTDIAISELGKTLDRGKNKGIPYNYLCAFNVKWCSFDLSVSKTILLEDDELERYKVRKGDLLICEGGDVGRAAIWEIDDDIYYQNALHRVRFKDSINQYFYLYVLQYYKSLGMIDDVSSGVTIKHFTQNSMKKLNFPLPPIKEQGRIVKAIQQYYRLIDNISANL